MKNWVLITMIIVLMSNQIFAQNFERNLSKEVWAFSKENENKWYSATVPGTIHTDLVQNKLISDPFYGTNERQLQWIEEENWIYKTNFIISESELNYENAILKFDGLDTYAEVFLNGVKILSANNMFRTWNVNLKGKLKKGNNSVEIRFLSAVKKTKNTAKLHPYTLPGDEKVFVRKAQYQFGWDWGPRFVTAGIWKDIKLQFWNTASITNVKYNQKTLNDELAELDFLIDIQSTKKGNFTLKVNDSSTEIQLQTGKNIITIPFNIKDPIRWWSNGLGKANLYDFEIALSSSDNIHSKSNLKIGLRTIELIQEQDKIGKSFYFKLNGIPVFMKGANYIPPDSFLPRVTDSIYKSIVKNAVDANMNMLRVWGGGVYADDAFYEECDKNGILVWQDFMFACAMYPGDNDYLENVKQEVIDNVTRLQNHPSIALWCGNNEIDEGWHNWGWQKQYKYSKNDSTKVWNNYKKLFHEVIPKTLDSLLPKNENRYWPSSPSIGWGRKESLLQGDSHYWGVWWGKEPFEIYEKKVGRFMSEYGFQGMPNRATFLSFASTDEMNLQSASVKNHQKHPTGYETINEYMKRDYIVPSKFEDYIYVSQLLQADGMKTAIEAHRRAKPYCMGTLYWQLNDCWPVTSWSSVDYFGRWKAFHYQAKRSFENVLISVQKENNNYKLYLINDDLQSFQGQFKAEILDFNGKKLLVIDEMVTLSGNSSVAYFEIKQGDINQFSLNEIVLSMQFTSGTKKIQSQYYFVKPKDLQLTKPNIKINRIDDFTIEITSDVLAKNVFLSSEEETFFSDNFFDILPNQKKLIKLSKPSQQINVKTVYDVFK